MKTQNSISEHVVKLLEQSYSRQQFFNQLKKSGYSLLRENGTIVGVKTPEGDHSFDSLGITTSRLETLDIINERVKHRIHKRLLRIEKHLGLKELGTPKQEIKTPKHQPRKTQN